MVRIPRTLRTSAPSQTSRFARLGPWLHVALVCLAAGVALVMAGAAPVATGGPPARLVVLISIDQFRADYLTRFADLYLPATGTGGAAGQPGGFRYLMERGAYFTDAHHDHYPLYTAPGHSVLLTGAPPYKSGIVGNSWYDRPWGRRRYCVEDPDYPLVGAEATAESARMGISPATLRVDTVGDELKMATGGQAKVWALAFKDRAAVLMGGRLADGALWFDDASGAWISSRFYRPDGKLPDWVAHWNAEKRVDRYFGKEWLLSVPPTALTRLWTPGNRYAADPSALGTGFPHLVTGGVKQPGKDFYAAFATTPFGNDYVFETARELVRHERLGQGEAADLLAINLSSNDYIGHAYGPDSPEVMDVSVRTDRQLAAFFDFLNGIVPGGLARVILVVTADHGVAPLPGAAHEALLPGGTFDDKAVADAVSRALAVAYGPGEWLTALVESNLYLDLAALDAHHIPHAQAEEIAAAALDALPGIYAAYPRSRILEGRLPATDVAARVTRSFHPRVSGDVVLVAAPFWMPGGREGTTHGTPYAYDTSVPLLMAGAGVRPGRFAERVSTLDIAPTLADLLGVLQPAGNEGRVLAVAEEPHR